MDRCLIHTTTDLYTNTYQVITPIRYPLKGTGEENALNSPAVTDDQDKGTLSQPRWLPRIHQYLVDEGVIYDNFFAPVSGHMSYLGAFFT